MSDKLNCAIAVGCKSKETSDGRKIGGCTRRDQAAQSEVDELNRKLAERQEPMRVTLTDDQIEDIARRVAELEPIRRSREPPPRKQIPLWPGGPVSELSFTPYIRAWAEPPLEKATACGMIAI